MDFEAEGLDFNEVKADLLRHNLSEFIQWGWPLIDPAPYEHNWHIDRIAEYLEAVTAGEIRLLLINVPPGHMKSMCCSVFWPTWMWTRKPSVRFLGTSYSEDLALRDADRARELIRHKKYQQLFGNMFQLRAGQNTKGRYENSEKGYRFSSSVDGIMGEGGEYILYDDPHNVQKAESPDVREKTVDLINLSLHTRVRSKSGGIVVIMQRLHESDYAGSMLQNLSDVVHLCLPARYETDHPHPCRSISLPSGRVLGGDERAREGELLFPGLFPDWRLKKLEEVMGSYGAAGQLQQRPAPRKGGLFARDWWEFIDAAEVPNTGKVVRGWDLAGSEKVTAKYTAGVRMRLTGGKIFIENVIRFRGTPLVVELTIQKVSEADGHEVAIDLPQDPGQAGKSQKGYLVGKLIGYDVHASIESGDKETRAKGLSAQAEAGNVFLVRGHWNKAFMDEAALFPRSTFTDQIDAGSRAFHRLTIRRRDVETKPVMTVYSGRT